jgi:hypothetical protein
MNGHGKKSVGQSTSPHRDPPRCSRGSLHRRWLPAARRYGWRRRRGGTGGRAGGEREERRRRHVVGETDSSEEEDRHVNLFCATPQIPGHIPGPRARCLCGLWWQGGWAGPPLARQNWASICPLLASSFIFLIVYFFLSKVISRFWTCHCFITFEFLSKVYTNGSFPKWGGLQSQSKFHRCIHSLKAIETNIRIV